MPLLENVRGKASSGETLATVMAMGKKLGKKAVLAGNCFGFIGNRMIEGYCREAAFLLEEGCVPAQVDGPIRKLGLAMGPLQMGDLAGNDIGYNIRKVRCKLFLVDRANSEYRPTPNPAPPPPLRIIFSPHVYAPLSPPPSDSSSLVFTPLPPYFLQLIP
jgi:3-hydroxyacyl-CoA dehydrogenase